jgi:hypothetical protein
MIQLTRARATFAPVGILLLLGALPAAGGEVAGTVANPDFTVTVSWDPSGAWSANDDGAYSIDVGSAFQFDSTTGEFRLAPGATTHFESQDTLTNGAPVITLDLVPSQTDINVDPIIAYGMQVVNNGMVSATFTKTVTAPILPVINGPTQVRAGISGSLFDKTGNGVAVTPAPDLPQDADGVAEMQIFRLRSNVGSGAWTNAGVDVGPADARGAGGAASTYTYGPYNLSPQSGPSGTWAQMQTRTRFSLSGFGDRATFTGFAEVIPVPEPGEWIMMLAGLGVVASVAARRRQSQLASV